MSNLFKWSFSACMVAKHLVRDPWRVVLRWLETVSNTFQDVDFNGS